MKIPESIEPENFKFDFLTYDIEAYLDHNKTFVPYQFGLYHPKLGYKSFYGKNCVKLAFDYIFNFQWETQKIIFYAHNGGKFDTIFLLRELYKREVQNIHSLKDKNNAFFSLQFNFNGYDFKFLDSFKLMPYGLDKLLKDFNINVSGLVGKVPFNHDWMSEKTLFYKGELPFWLKGKEKILSDNGISLNPFSIQKYCEFYNRVDCEGLHLLIKQFFSRIVTDFKLNLTHCVTLPQLSMELFRAKWLENSKTIRLLSNRHYNFIKEAYKGANVSVYKPYGENLYAYDINSLYPYCMLKPMPVGTPKPYDISNGLENLFGFAYAKIYCPNTLKIPVLPVKSIINGTEKLIFPTGKFQGTFFSEELKYAKALGYEITLIQAIQFDSHESLFKGYVDHFYQIKSEGKGAARAIAKLFLNSLYGRFAMQKDFDFNIITNTLAVQKLIEKFFVNIIPVPLSLKTVLYSFSLSPNPENKKVEPEIYDLLDKHYQGLSDSRIGNIAVAAAITAYARCEIDKYKRIPGNDCYYSDTDCVHLQYPLPKSLLGDQIGLMKNELADSKYSVAKDSEYFYRKGLFLRDKVYSLVLQNDQEITKFSGLNRRLIPKNCFNLLYKAYLDGSDVVLSSSWIQRAINALSVSYKDGKKVFNFNYDKRLVIRDREGRWVDTKPIEISSRNQSQDLAPIIKKEQVAILNQTSKYGLEPFQGTINQNAVCDSKNKHFDGYFLNYNMEVSNDPLKTLKDLINLASKDGVLVEKVPFLLTENYNGKQNTISYMCNFTTAEQLLNIYQQHLDYMLNKGVSGKILGNSESGYIIDGLTLRIRIPNEQRPESSPSIITRIKKVFSKT